MANVSKIDWKPIKKQYIHSPNVSIQQIAKKNNVSYNAMRIQIHRNNWKQERDEYWSGLEADAKEAAKNRILIEKDEFDEKINHINNALLHQTAVILKEGQETSDPTRRLKAGDVRSLQGTIKECVETKYRILGIQMPKQTIEHELIAAPSDDLDLSKLDFDIDAKIESTQFVPLELPEPKPNGGNGNGSNGNGSTD